MLSIKEYNTGILQLLNNTLQTKFHQGTINALKERTEKVKNNG